MDIKPKVMTDVQKQTFQHIFEKIVANNNKFPPKEIENFRSLLENVRDRDQKYFNMIMEKLKSSDHMESDMFREGKQRCFFIQCIFLLSVKGERDILKRKLIKSNSVKLLFKFKYILTGFEISFVSKYCL